MSDEVMRRLERIEAQLQALTTAVEGMAGTAVPTPTPAEPDAASAVQTQGAEAQDAQTREPDAEVPYAGLLTDLFAAALSVRPEDCWTGLESLTHSEDLQAPRAVDHLRAFNWKRFRTTAGSYLKDGAPGSWEISRSLPAVIDDTTTLVKVFLQRAGANPAPVSIAREGGPHGPWRVRNLSL